jgi:two-component system nitrogen regulation response regulator GlnG
MEEKPLILIVDDEKSIRSLLSKLLKNKGFRTQVAEDGLDGLGAVADSLPDLIITDFKMPKLNGIEFLAKIWENYPDIPVIFVSAYFQFPEDLSDIHQGKTSFCPKPIDLQDLMAKVNGHLGLEN